MRGKRRGEAGKWRRPAHLHRAVQCGGNCGALISRSASSGRKQSRRGSCHSTATGYRVVLKERTAWQRQQHQVAPSYNRIPGTNETKISRQQRSSWQLTAGLANVPSESILDQDPLQGAQARLLLPVAATRLVGRSAARDWMRGYFPLVLSLNNCARLYADAKRDRKVVQEYRNI